VKTWQSALSGTAKREDRFALLSYLYQAFMDWGKYREALEYGHHQLNISEDLDSRFKMEAYLNLSRANERLGQLDRALSYARHSLYNECDTQCRTGGMVHLTVAGIYLEMGGFSRALESLQGAHKIGKVALLSTLALN
jgi:tetratricopeptide (TPR) repeat protein